MYVPKFFNLSVSIQDQSRNEKFMASLIFWPFSVDGWQIKTHFNIFGKIACSLTLFFCGGNRQQREKKRDLSPLSRRRLSQSVVALVLGAVCFCIVISGRFCGALRGSAAWRGIVIARRLAADERTMRKGAGAALNPSSPHHPQKIAMAAVRARRECVRNNKVIHKMRSGPHCSCAWLSNIAGIRAQGVL